MINDRNMLICDCCGRQVVDNHRTDKHTVNGKNRTRLIGINKHACGSCYSDWLEWAKMDMVRLGYSQWEINLELGG